MSSCHTIHSSIVCSEVFNQLNEYPRVTEILRAYSGYDKIPIKILDNAAARGTTVHAICAGIAKGAWIPDGMIQEDLRGYINSFKQWSDLFVKEYKIVEKRFTNEDNGYTGQLDFVIEGTDGQLYLVDLKTTSKPQKTHLVQMAAYDCLLRQKGIIVKASILVYLDKDGKFPLTIQTDDMNSALTVFLCALECYKYFNPRKNNDRTEAA